MVAETQKVREGVEEHNNIIEAVGTRLDHGKAPECGFRSPAEQLFDFWVAMLPPRRMKQRANTPSIADAGWFLEFSIPGERSGGARRIWRSQDHTGQLLAKPFTLFVLDLTRLPTNCWSMERSSLSAYRRPRRKSITSTTNIRGQKKRTRAGRIIIRRKPSTYSTSTYTQHFWGHRSALHKKNPPPASDGACSC